MCCAYNYDHSIINLADDYSNYGSLDNVSAFPFENYLGLHIKSPVRSGNVLLSQIANHVTMQNDEFADHENNKCVILKKNPFL